MSFFWLLGGNLLLLRRLIFLILFISLFRCRNRNSICTLPPNSLIATTSLRRHFLDRLHYLSRSSYNYLCASWLFVYYWCGVGLLELLCGSLCLRDGKFRNGDAHQLRSFLLYEFKVDLERLIVAVLKPCLLVLVVITIVR